MSNTTAPPVAGDKLDIYSVDCRGTRAHHDAKPVGSSHTTCTFNSAASDPLRDSDVELGNGLLAFSADRVVGGNAEQKARSRCRRSVIPTTPEMSLSG